MLKLHEVKSSFEFLYNLYEPSELILIGVDAEKWVESVDKMALTKVTFIDADVHKVNHLKNINTLPSNWIVLNNLVYKKQKDVVYYELSISKLNGTIQADTLQSLWKNIYEKNHRFIHAKRLDDVIVTEEKIFNNSIVIECFGALEILKGAEKLLKTTDIIFAKSTLSDNEELEKINQRKLSVWLKKRGFKNIGFIEDNHPEVGLAIYVKDTKKELAVLNIILQEKVQENEKLSSELSMLKEEQQKLLKDLETEKTKAIILQKDKEKLSKTIQTENIEVEQLKKDVETKNKDLTQTLEQERQSSTNLKKELETAKIKIETLQNQKDELNNSFDRLIKVLSELDESIKRKIEDSKKDVKNYIASKSIITAKQIESYISINNYISNGEKPLDFHGWPISPDIAFFLVNKIIENSYDLILEFGSGSSTLLFAKALKVKYNNSKHMPKQVAIEHNKKYLNKTKNILALDDLEKNVQLVLAPLKEMEYHNQYYKYYDCKDVFKNFRKKNYKKILVLVDGPPGATNKNARLPAIKYILEYLSDAEIDIVLDDAYRNDEKDTIKIWEDIMKSENINFESELIKNEKGIYFCKIGVSL